jgi:phenylpropionate dioxygenase-like ring-hydroxylating dioxygenase large terminal subunit
MATPIVSAQRKPQDIIAEALSLSLKGRQFPGSIYTSAELYELEKERIFRKDWQIVGRTEHYPKAGDYKVHRIVGESVIVCRNDEGELNAFRNVCAHRGAEVANGEGNTKAFRCPYHAWVYGLDGSLKRVTNEQDIQGFDIASCRLAPVGLQTWGGFVFINLAKEGPDLLGKYGDVLGKCDFLRTGEMRAARLSVLEPKCNWKLINENVFDLYHLNVVHANSFARDFNPRDFKLYPLSGGSFYGAYRSRSLGNAAGKSLFGSIPWLDGDESSAFAAQILPTFSILVRHDAVYALIVEPLGVERCRLTIYTLFPQDWFGREDFEANANQYNDFINLIFSEDIDMLAALQTGISSDAYVPGPATELEAPVHYLTKDILQRLAEGGAA